MSTRVAKAVAWATAAVVLAFAGYALAQSKGTLDHFTFVAANGAPPSPAGETRLGVTITRWSTEGEKTAVLTALKAGPDAVRNVVRLMYDAGYMDWPGGQQHIFRYATRTPAADGGEDILLIVDLPVDIWWDKAADRQAGQPFAAFQIHIGKDGRGEGRLVPGTKLTAGNGAVAVQDVSQQPVLLTDLRRG
jgi:hypothetical protein